MADYLRKGATGEAGNDGEFGTHYRSAPDVRLAPWDPIDDQLDAAWNRVADIDAERAYAFARVAALSRAKFVEVARERFGDATRLLVVDDRIIDGFYAGDSYHCFTDYTGQVVTELEDLHLLAQALDPRDDRLRIPDGTRITDRSDPGSPREVTQDDLDADRDHEPRVSGDYCTACRRVVTEDGLRHGLQEKGRRAPVVHDNQF